MNLFNAGYQKKTEITNSSLVTEESKYALDAKENNPSQPNTIAYRLARKLDAVSGAPAHNEHFEGRNFTNLVPGDLCAPIADGSFDNRYIGDYFDLEISTPFAANEVTRIVLAGFDTYWNNGDTPFTRHHAVCVTKNCMAATAQMNPTDTTENGFKGSHMWQYVLPAYETALRAKLGSHLLTHRVLFTNAVSTTGASMAGAGMTGYASNWTWADTTLSLLSEIQVYGTNIWSSSGYDTGCDNQQLPLFRLDPTAKVCGIGGTASGGRQWYWLRNVASATYFCSVDNYGFSSYFGASGNGSVRLVFCIG